VSAGGKWIIWRWKFFKQGINNAVASLPKTSHFWPPKVDSVNILFCPRPTCEVATVPRIAGSHHVLGVEHLLGELGHGEGPVLLAAAGGQWREAGHEEVEAGEGHHVHRQLPQVGVELAGEAEAGGDAGHGEGDQVVEVAVGRRGELQGPAWAASAGAAGVPECQPSYAQTHMQGRPSQ
jgi:hypothetical protein